jgi:hypothetical protein
MNVKSKPLNNSVCAYRDCRLKPRVRLFFPLGFSALFCQKCAKILLADRLATPEASDYENGIYLDGVYDSD